MDSLIPIQPLRPYICRYIDAQLDPSQAINELAERAEVHYDTVRAIVNERQRSISFDLADRLLCAMHAVQLWRQDPTLREIYSTVDLRGDGTPPKDRCQRPGCVNKIQPKPGAVPGRTKYCSRTCHHAAYMHRSGRRGRVEASAYRQGERRVRELDGVCRNNHERTPENTQELANGTRRCRVCALERTQECRARQRLQVAA